MRSQIYSKAKFFTTTIGAWKNAKFLQKIFLTAFGLSSFSSKIFAKLSNKSYARNNALRQCAWRHCEFNSHCKERVAGDLSS
jgi:hypothetical protein